MNNTTMVDNIKDVEKFQKMTNDEAYVALFGKKAAREIREIINEPIDNDNDMEEIEHFLKFQNN